MLLWLAKDNITAGYGFYLEKPTPRFLDGFTRVSYRVGGDPCAHISLAYKLERVIPALDLGQAGLVQVEVHQFPDGAMIRRLS